MDYLISVIESFRLAWLETSFYFIKNTIMPIPMRNEGVFFLLGVVEVFVHWAVYSIIFVFVVILFFWLKDLPKEIKACAERGEWEPFVLFACGLLTFSPLLMSGLAVSLDYLYGIKILSSSTIAHNKTLFSYLGNGFYLGLGLGTVVFFIWVWRARQKEKKCLASDFLAEHGEKLKKELSPFNLPETSDEQHEKIRKIISGYLTRFFENKSETICYDLMVILGWLQKNYPHETGFNSLVQYEFCLAFKLNEAIEKYNRKATFTPYSRGSFKALVNYRFSECYWFRYTEDVSEY